MRAVYIPEMKKTWEEIAIEGDQHKHLVKVARVTLEEKILILNGKGLMIQGKVKSFDKKRTVIEVIDCRELEDKRTISLALGVPKREALEEVLRKSVELGIKKIILVASEYSQKLNVKVERFQKIVESAYCQSNNPWSLEVTGPVAIKELEKDILNHEKAFLMSLNGEGKRLTTYSPDKNSLLIVGPEGGFSPSEEENFFAMENVFCLGVETPILRTPTAVVAGFGYLHGATSCRT